MYISKIVIKNFRNFEFCTVELEKEASNQLVIIGETQSGKTNFLYALRLLLDPHKNRLLEDIEILDFHNANKAEKIKIAIELTSDSEHPLRGLLYDCYISHVISTDQQSTGSVITSVKGGFGVSIEYNADTEEIDYKYFLGAIPAENDTKPYLKSFPSDLSKAFELGYLEPLRDVVSELKNKQNTPLRWALQKVQKKMNPETSDGFKAIDSGIRNSFREFLSNHPLEEKLNQSYNNLIGSRHSLEYRLHPRAMEIQHIFSEAGIVYMLPMVGKDNPTFFELTRGSLGLNNALYLNLKRLMHTDKDFQKPSKSGLKDIEPFFWLAIEEPEAHLHPHLQRQVYRNLTKASDAVNKSEDTIQPKLDFELFGSLVSTHSPHLVSIADPRSYLLLRREAKNRTKICQFKQIKKNPKMDQPEQWSELELAKLKNYLQVTRAEMVFASGVILVEGIAERNLITAWYPELDEEGISVCSIDGVDFEIYESFLKDFEIPYVIITDWDPKQTKELVGDQNKSTNSYLKSKNRNIVSPPVYTDHNGCTLEWALLRIEFYKNIIKDIAVENQPDAGENNFKSAADACPLTFKKLWKNMDLNKGLVSKKLASEIQIKRSELLKCKQGKSYTLVQEEVEIPPYIKRAVEYLKSQCVGENTNKMGNTVGAMKLTENPVSEETVTRL